MWRGNLARMRRRHIPQVVDEFVGEPLEETLGHGCSELTLDVMQRFTTASWRHYAEICQVPARRWRTAEPVVTKRIIERVDDGTVAFNLGAWHAFVSLLPGAVAFPDALAHDFGVDRAAIRPPDGAPSRRRDAARWRRMHDHIGTQAWPKLLTRAARWLAHDWPLTQDAWRARLDAASSQLRTDPERALRQFRDLLDALMRAWHAPVVIDHVAATSRLRCSNAHVLDERSGEAPAFSDAIVSLLRIRPDDTTSLDAWINTYGWYSMRSLELAAAPFRSQRTQLENWLAEKRRHPPRVVTDTPPVDEPIDGDIVIMRRATMLREAAGDARSAAFALLRQAAAICADAFTEAGLIDQPGELFRLRIDDLDRLLHDPQDRPQITAKPIQPATATVDPPRADANATASPASSASPASPAPPDILHGIAASRGQVSADFIVLDAPAIDAPVTGRIIVCRHTDPAWMPLLIACAGLVTERGSQLSHAAIVARELQLPAVVAATDARRLVDGASRLHVDGSRGSVRIER